MKPKDNQVNVLLIDDDEDEYFFIRDIFAETKGKKFKLEWTKDITEAKQKMIARSHDIYLLDYRLGKISGVELLKEVVKAGFRGPVILLTGYDDEDVDREAMAVGAADYLQKSYLTSYLLERSLRYAIYRNQMRNQAISQDRMASIGLLSSSLAHEIGTPMGVIRGRAELLSMQAGDNPVVKKNVEIIISQIDRVSGLVRSLLNLARGDVSDTISPVSLNTATSNTITLLEHELKKNQIKVNTQFCGEEPNLISGEREKLEQIMLNLFMNAIHAIKLKRQNHPDFQGVINVVCEVNSTVYDVKVQDNGCGMSDHTLKNIFRPFFTTKSTNEGTGLGLSTTQWIVESWSGSIEVQSKEGEGTIFTLHLPKAFNS